MPIQSETLLRALESARIGVTIVAATPEGGMERVFANQALADALGRTLEDLQAMPVGLPIAPEERDRFESLRAAWARGDKVPGSFRTVVIAPDGRRITIEVTAAVTRLEGRPVTVSFIRDLTESVEIEEALRRSEARFRRLAEGAPDGITLHVRGRLVYANQAILAMLGAESFESIARKGILERLPEADREAMIDRLAQVATGASLPAREYRLANSTTSTEVVEVHSIGFEHEGQAAVLSFVRDTTERHRMLEDLRRADRLAALGTLAAAVAHEVNNPLTYVLLHLGELKSLLQEKLSDDDRAEAGRKIDEALEGAERVRLLVRDLLSFARADPGSRRAVAPEAALESAIKLAGNVLRHRAALVRDYGADTAVAANAARLEQVFLNLLVNAAQAFPDDRPRPGVIKVSTRAESAHRVLIEIADDGPGIPAADLPRVFEPFFTTKPDGIGTGLGLAISRTIIDSFGGEISVHSPAEGGTTVSIRLPAAEGTLANESTPTPPPVPAPLVRAKLLIVDDEVRLASVLLTLLGDHHDVQVATGAEEALAFLRNGSDFDVVLCDLMMPVMTGMDLHDIVSRERPDLAQRFVFLTGGAFTERAADFVARPDVVMILKPFDLAQVEGAIQARMQRR